MTTHTSRLVAGVAAALLLVGCSSEGAEDTDAAAAVDGDAGGVDDDAELSDRSAVDVDTAGRRVMLQADRRLAGLLPEAEISYGYLEDTQTLVVDVYVEDPDAFDREDEIREALADLTDIELRVNDLDSYLED